MSKSKNLHITLWLIITIVMMYIFYKINGNSFMQLFVLKSGDISKIIPWQFITYTFYFPENIFFFFFNVMIFFYFSSTLEALWGSLHYGIFLLIIILSKSIACFLFGPLPVIGHWSLYLCLMIAFGFNMPDEKIFLFFIIPIRVRTLAIISSVFVPIDIISSMIYPSGTEGFFGISLSIGSLISGLLSYVALLIYYPKVFGKKEVKIDHIVEKIQKNIKNIEQTQINEEMKSKNSKYLEFYNKTQDGGEINSEEKNSLSDIEENYNDICDELDFDENDDYCLSCDKYGKCIKRKIEKS